EQRNIAGWVQSKRPDTASAQAAHEALSDDTDPEPEVTEGDATGE
ncbi:MAG: hypothetical protein JWR83_1077, partial [Aeromicrobium sp.]|nr:hypothetical protein [Aeromicrobium sp.]